MHMGHFHLWAVRGRWIMVVYAGIHRLMSRSEFFKKDVGIHGPRNWHEWTSAQFSSPWISAYVASNHRPRTAHKPKWFDPNAMNMWPFYVKNRRTLGRPQVSFILIEKGATPLRPIKLFLPGNFFQDLSIWKSWISSFQRYQTCQVSYKKKMKQSVWKMSVQSLWKLKEKILWRFRAT